MMIAKLRGCVLLLAFLATTLAQTLQTEKAAFVANAIRVDVSGLVLHGDPARGFGETVNLVQGATRRVLQNFAGGVRRLKVTRRDGKPATFRLVYSKTEDEATAFDKPEFKTSGTFFIDLTAGRTDGAVDMGRGTYYIAIYADGIYQGQLRVELNYRTGSIEVTPVGRLR